MATTAVIGLEDIAFGKGTRQVPTYGGEHRLITEVNLANMPFDETKTVGEALEEFNTHLTSANYSTIQQNIEGLKLIISKMGNIDILLSKMPDVDRVNTLTPHILAISQNMSALLRVPEEIKEVYKLNDSLKYLISDFMEASKCYTEDIAKANQLVSSKLEPLSEAMTAQEIRLNSLIATAVSQVHQGHEFAVKMSTYNFKLKTTKMCKQPMMQVDDTAKTITFHVPRPICATQYNVDQEIMNSAISSYLVSHPIQSGTDEAKVNQLIAVAVSALKGGADADSDTLKELADQIVANQGGVTDEHITELAKAYHDEHQVVVQQYPLVPEDQLEGE